MKPLIIGLLTTTDGGKSLLQDYFRKNFSSQIYESTNRGGSIQVSETVKKYSEDDLKTDEVMFELISKHGCDALIFLPHLTKTKLKEFYKRLTKRERIFIFCRCEDYTKFCDVGIYVNRDIRARWAVTQHRSPDVETYANVLLTHFHIYENMRYLKNNILEVDFESLIAAPKKWIEKIRKHTQLEYDTEFIPSTKIYNKWLTQIDLKNLRKYVDDGDLLKQEELDYLSDVFEKYNKYFGYPPNMSIKDLYPKTLKTDIEEFMKTWKE